MTSTIAERADLARAVDLAGTLFRPAVLEELHAQVPDAWRQVTFQTERPPLRERVRSTRNRHFSLATLPEVAQREAQWVMWHWAQRGRRLVGVEVLTTLFRTLQQINAHREQSGLPALVSLTEFDLQGTVRFRRQDFQRRSARLPSVATTTQFRRALGELQAPLLLRYSQLQWWEHGFWRADDDARIPISATSPYRGYTLNLTAIRPSWLREATRLMLRDGLTRNTLSWTTAVTYGQLLTQSGGWLQGHDEHGPLLAADGAGVRGYTNRLIAGVRSTPRADGTLPSPDGLRRQQHVLQAVFTYAYDNSHELAQLSGDRRWLQLYPEHLRLWSPAAIVVKKRPDTADERSYLPDVDLADLLADLDVLGMPRTATKTVTVRGQSKVVHGLGHPQAMRAWLLQQLCGRRASEIMLLEFDPLHQPGLASTGEQGEQDKQPLVKLRYGQVKVEGVDTTIFVGQDVVQIVREQQAWVRAHLRLPQDQPDPPWLFIKLRANQHGTSFWNGHAYRSALHKLDRLLDKTDQSGRPLRYARTHRLRHTKATDLLNAGAPIHVVQRYLGHRTPTMTTRYAKTLEATAEREFLRTQKLRRDGNPLGIEPADLYALLHLDKRTDRVLPTGYCLLPPVKTCGKGNACYSCDEYATDVTYLDEHQDQLARTRELITTRQRLFHDRTGTEMSPDNVWLRERLIEIASLEAIIKTLTSQADAPRAARGGAHGRTAVLLDTTPRSASRFHDDAPSSNPGQER